MNLNKLDKFIEISRALMPSNFSKKTFHTTFIVKKNKIIKIGINSYKTHPRNLLYNYRGKEDNVDIRRFVAVHSELSAILKYGKDDCSDCTFVNVRIDKNGVPCMSKPCIGCSDLLNTVGFKRLYYTNDNGIFVEYGYH